MSDAPDTYLLPLTNTAKPALQRILQHLRPLLLQQAIGLSLSGSRSQVEPGVSAYQIRDAECRIDEPLAVVDMARFMAMFSPLAEVERLLAAKWIPKPSADSRVSLGFMAASLGTCMWQYAGRSEHNFLPSRYQTRLIFARRSPHSDARLLTVEHREVLELLRDEPRTLAQLVTDTDWSTERVGKALEGLYLAGAISTQPKSSLHSSSFRTSTGSGSTTTLPTNPSATTSFHEDE
jgi:hypothetical protein